MIRVSRLKKVLRCSGNSNGDVFGAVFADQLFDKSLYHVLRHTTETLG